MRHVLFLSVVLVLCLGGCRDRVVLGANGELRVLPDRIDFPSAWVGHRVTGAATVQNAGRRAIELQLTVTPPFEAPATLVVAAGEAVVVEVALVPEAAGAIDGVLTFAADGRSLDVPLHAVAQATPSCTPADCFVSTFDPATGACVEVPGDDGAACGRDNACVSNGVCRAGECVGELRDCDDGDACTHDTCNAAAGCQHAEVVCAGSTNPCEAPVCRPGTGCGVAPVEDGVACGANDCVTAHVCISGACVQRPAPDGSQCAAATPCRGPGTCANAVCMPGPAVAQRPAWTYTPPPERELSFLGHVDNDGNVYFAETFSISDSGETDALVTELVSYSPAGVQRFRTTIATACEACRYGVDFAIDTAGGRLFVKLRQALIALALADGRELWRLNVTSGLPVYEPNSSGAGSFSVSPPMLVGTTGVAVPVMEGQSSHHGYVRVYDRATGAFLWQFHRKGHLYTPGVTGTGELWVSSADCWAPAGEMARLAPDGRQLGVKFVSWIPRIYGGASAFGPYNGKAYRLDDSFTLHDLSPVLGTASTTSNALVSGDQYVFIDSQRRELVSADLASGQQQHLSEPRPVAALQLLRGGGVGWTGATAAGGYVRAVDGAGQELYACDVSEPPNGYASFVRGRLYAGSDLRIVVYETPGLDAAPVGWVGDRGSPERSGRAR